MTAITASHAELAAADTGIVPHQSPEACHDALLCLELTYTQTGAVIQVVGEVDRTNLARLQELVHSRLRSELTELVLDLSQTSFLCLRAARMLLDAMSFARSHAAELRIHPGESRVTHRALLAVGLDTCLPEPVGS